MTVDQIRTIIDKFEGTGTFVLDKPLVLRKVNQVVNIFDWSMVTINYRFNRLIFTEDGLYFIIPVSEVKNEPKGVIGSDYDIVDGRYWIYMKPAGKLAFDILPMDGIQAFNILPGKIGGNE